MLVLGVLRMVPRTREKCPGPGSHLMDKLGHGMQEKHLWLCFPAAGMCSSWQDKMPRLWHELPHDIGSVFWLL